MQITSNRDAERFWQHVQVVLGDLGACWLWTGALVNSSGQFSLPRTADFQRRRISAHRYAWSLLCGPIPPGLLVLHTCEEPACCRPSHLWLATPAECMANAARAGRMASGSRNPAAKLSQDQASAIRQLYRQSLPPPPPPATRWTQSALADHFGVAQSTIHYLLAGRHWRDPTTG